MKTGILTFHNACNYGAVLQCYALQEVLIGMGHDVDVIDYRNKWVEDIYKPFSLYILKHYKRNPRTFLKYIFGYFDRKRLLSLKLHVFSDFIQHNLKLSEFDYVAKKAKKVYDVIFIGSDQLWGLSCLGGTFDDVYLGNFSHKKTKLVGYAISADLKSFQTLEKSNLLLSVMNNFSAFSCREEKNADFLQEATHMPIDVCIDPTLLLPKEGWEKIVNKQWEDKTYIVLYHVRNKETQKQYMIDQANKIAKTIGDNCEVIDLGKSYKVEDFVSAIKYAKLVITSSFHATVFSLIFRTPFYSIVLNDGYDGRYVSLLQKLNLDSRIVKVGDEIAYSNSIIPDYSLESISYSSIDFIKSQLI